MPRRAAAALALLVLGTLVGGCADPMDREAAMRTCVHGLEGATGIDADGYRGLDAETAETRAGLAGLQVRVVGRDGGCTDRTDDLREDRLNVYLLDGRVSFAAVG